MEKVAQKLPHVDTSGMDVPAGTWVRAGWYPSRRRWAKAGTSSSTSFAHGSSEQSCMEIGMLTKAFNEGDHNEEDVKKRKYSGTEVSKVFP